jgi:MFS family permease
MNSSMIAVPPRANSDSNANTGPAPGRTSASASSLLSPDIIETDIPARLDALPWGRFHTLVVVALGVTWILDGLEVTMTGALSGVLKETTTLGLSNAEIGLAATAYLVGAISGALFFGWLTDRLGRKKLFFITLTVYLVATAATALSWNFWSFALLRLATGAGIGGEYTAINSTIQELIPARVRGWTDLIINGSFWVGAAIGAGAAIVLLDPAVIDPTFGWRLAFLIGAVLGLVIVVMRLWIPESPRWLMIHGDAQRAETIVSTIEERLGLTADRAEHDRPRVRLRRRTHTSLAEVGRTLFRAYRQRTLVGFASAAASSAYLTVSETFPLEIRALAIAFFYAVGTSIGGAGGPWLLGALIDTGSRDSVAAGYLLGAVLMIFAACVEWRWGVAAERRPLEEISRPLAFVD